MIFCYAQSKLEFKQTLLCVTVTKSMKALNLDTSFCPSNLLNHEQVKKSNPTKSASDYLKDRDTHP